MDSLTGRVSATAHPIDPDAGHATLPPGVDVSQGSGPGYQYRASARTGRLRAWKGGHDWRACVGAPHAGAGEGDMDAMPASPGPEAERRLAGLGGEFAIATYDARDRTLVLATDRFASVPLFYAAGAAGIVFGTDFAWVSRHAAPAEAAIDPQSVYDYLFFSVVPGSRTIRRGVHKLPAASTLVYRDGVVRIARYWNPDFRREEPMPPDELRARAFDALSGAVRRLASLPDSGCFLSGGLDSSSVAGLAALHAPGPVRAFTIGFDVPDYDESRYARISAGHFGLDLRERQIRSADVSACIDRVIGAFPEPFGNASAVSAYLCAQFARDNGVLHLLAGDGGDELFGGNERYQKQSMFNVYGDLPGWVRRAAIDPLAAASRVAPAPLNKLWSYVQQARVPLPDRLFSYNLLVRNDPSTVLTPEFLTSVDRSAPYAYAGAVYREPPAGDALDRMLYLDWALTLTDNDLPKVRVACELAGVTVHFPMLDPEVVRVSTLVPTRQKLDLRTLRKFYKEAFSGFLPAEVISKQKHGFGVPVGIWINGDAQLRDRVYGRLRSLAGRGIVQPDFIDDLLRLQQTGHAVYYGALMWSLFMLEEWLLAHPA